MVSEECKTLYNKLNTFVTKVINRDVPNKVYPIGSIYISVNSTNPSELFGGTWEQIQDTFLLASGTTYENNRGINYPATDTSYHAYNGQTVPVADATTITTLTGINNVFADAGSVTVQYKYMSM